MPAAGSPFTGTSLARSEDFAFLTGQARYIADLGATDDPRLAGAAYAVFVRSTMAHARVKDVTTTDAENAPGVLKVYTAANHGVAQPGPTYGIPVAALFAQPLLAEAKVRYVGEPIAVVVAATHQQAVDAAEEVIVNLEPLDPVLDLEDSLRGQTPLFVAGDAPVFQNHVGDHAADEAPSGNVASTAELHVGAPSPAAQVSVAQRITNPRQSPAPIEPRGLAAFWDCGHLYVWAATQRPHGFRAQLAEFYQLPTDNIHVIAPAVGGGFGGKVSRSVEEQLIPALARDLGRAVRWVDTRSEYLASATQGRGELFDFTLTGNADGEISSIAVKMIKDLGAYPGVGTYLAGGYTLPMACGVYNVDHVDFECHAVLTNRATIGAFRGAGRSPYLAALERMVDIYAAKIGRDPADVRRRNLITADMMPFTTIAGATYDEADYLADLNLALEIADYQNLRLEQAARRSGEQPLQLGIGIGSYCHKTTGGGGEEAHVRITAEGKAVVTTGTTSQGHGHVTTWAQIASDVLGIAPHDISIVEGNTDAIASGVGAVGSRSLQTAGLAVHKASGAVVDRARNIAAQLLEAAVGDIVLDTATGNFHVVGTPARSVDWVAVATLAHDEDLAAEELSCGEFYDNDGRDTYPSGSVVAVVEVDVETGKAKLVRLISVDDAGVRVNPMIVDGQIHGGLAAGIAQVLGEEIVYDSNGNLLTSNFMDYAIGSIDQFPQFELHASVTASSHNELGFKAVGESGPMGAVPAVHNAIVDAVRHLGINHIDLPCTPQRIWEALEAQR